jgi:hypothetical protein
MPMMAPVESPPPVSAGTAEEEAEAEASPMPVSAGAGTVMMTTSPSAFVDCFAEALQREQDYQITAGRSERIEGL